MRHSDTMKSGLMHKGLWLGACALLSAAVVAGEGGYIAPLDGVGAVIQDVAGQASGQRTSAQASIQAQTRVVAQSLDPISTLAVPMAAPRGARRPVGVMAAPSVSVFPSLSVPPSLSLHAPVPVSPGADTCPDAVHQISMRAPVAPSSPDVVPAPEWRAVSDIVREAEDVLNTVVPAALAQVDAVSDMVPAPLRADDIAESAALADDLHASKVDQLQAAALMALAQQRTETTLAEVSALKAKTFGGPGHMVLIDDVAGVLRDPELMIGGVLLASK